MEELKEKPTKYYIHMAVILVLMFGVGFLPPFGPITAYGMRVLGIFLGCIYAWTIGETIWPSILALVLLGLSGENSLGTILSSAYGQQNVIMVVAALLYCYAISQSGVLEIIAERILSMKFAQKNPWTLALAFFVTSAVASALVLASLPVVLLLWTMFYGICEKIGAKPYSKYVTLVMIGICISSYAGSLIMPYAAWTLFCMGIFQAMVPGAAFDPLSYSLFMLALNVVLIAVMVLLLKLLVGKIDYNPIEIDKSGKRFTVRQKIVLSSIAVLAAMIILPTLLPAGNPVGTFLSKIGALGSLVILPVVLMMCTYKRVPFVDINEGMKFGVTWNLIFLLATALTLSSAIVSADTGIAVLLSQMFAPLLSGQSFVVVVAILVALGTVITNCINNVVTFTLITPIMFTYVSALGGDPVVAIILLIFTTLQGVVMPAGSILGALMHGNIEWLKGGMIYKYGTILEIALIVVVIVVGLPLATVLF